jgi:hypothetical protein
MKTEYFSFIVALASSESMASLARFEVLSKTVIVRAKKIHRKKHRHHGFEIALKV